jgi:hypothetical protein
MPVTTLHFQSQTIAASILALPVLDNRFRRIVQPVRVSEQTDQFDGAKEFYRIGPRLGVITLMVMVMSRRAGKAGKKIIQ